MLRCLREIIIWKTSCFSGMLKPIKNIPMLYKTDSSIATYQTRSNSIMKLFVIRFCIFASIINSCIGSYRICLSKLDLQFTSKIYNWTQIMKETGTIIVKHNLKTVKIFVIFIGKMARSYLVPNGPKIDARNEPNLSILILQILISFYRKGLTILKPMRKVEQFYPIHHCNAPEC